jgi:hypothetical protein
LTDSIVCQFTPHQRLFAVMSPVVSAIWPAQNVGLDAAELQFRSQCRHIDVLELAVRPVLDDAFVRPVPRRHEETFFRDHVFVGVEYQHL